MTEICLPAHSTRHGRDARGGRVNVARLSVLYVEDEVLLALDGEATLKDLGFEHVKVAFSVSDALFELERRAFDVALLDVNLRGGTTSLHLADALQKRGTPIVFASNYDFSRALVSRYGAPLIRKPFDSTAVEAALVEVMGRQLEPAGAED